MVSSIRLGCLVLVTLFTLAACGGDKKEAAKEEAPDKAAEKAATEAPAKAEAEEKKEKEDDKDSMKERAATAYAALHCVGTLATPDKASETYKEHGFKGPAHFMKVWKHYSKKDADWAHDVASKAEKTDCKK